MNKIIKPNEHKQDLKPQIQVQNLNELKPCVILALFYVYTITVFSNILNWLLFLDFQFSVSFNIS